MKRVDLTIPDVQHQLLNHFGYDIYRGAELSDKVSDGWKLSIQGKSPKDAEFLYNRLVGLLQETQTPYKLGTAIRTSHSHPEQSKKVMTIYVRNDMDVKEFAEKVHYFIADYKGGEGIPNPTSYTHYKGAIYYRNDRDENGEYITAN
jgi:hypothetical protein